jgi:20S proteasome alpha/beta subunit
MTFVAGFRCLDGLVLCSDSRESDGHVDRNVRKLSSYHVSDEWGVAIGGAGDAFLIRKFRSRLFDLLGNGNYDRVGTEVHIESALTTMQQQHPDDELKFVVGLFSQQPWEVNLYRAEQGRISPQDAFCFIGQDATLANFIVESIFDPRVRVDEAARLAIFVTSLMKRHADGVGGPTQCLTHTKGESGWKTYDLGEITTIESELPSHDAYRLLLNYWRSKHNTGEHQVPKRLASRASEP